jgi:hypothetical protein
VNKIILAASGLSKVGNWIISASGYYLLQLLMKAKVSWQVYSKEKHPGPTLNILEQILVKVIWMFMLE